MANKEIFSEKAPEPIGPYSQAMQSGDTLYLSGQIAIDQSTGQLVQDSVMEETHQVMKNIGHVLEAAGYSYSDVVKCSIFLSDMGYFAEVNEIYSAYFSDPYPARECVQVSVLPMNVNVEISLIAQR